MASLSFPFEGGKSNKKRLNDSYTRGNWKNSISIFPLQIESLLKSEDAELVVACVVCLPRTEEKQTENFFSFSSPPSRSEAL